jgi:hypothetical protein
MTMYILIATLTSWIITMELVRVAMGWPLWPY